MKKEVLLAIFIGFILGLIITFGVWTANQSLKQLPQNLKAKPTPTLAVSSPDSDITLSPTPDPGFPLTISAPEDEALVTSSSLTVTGTTSPKASVALVYDAGNQIVETDSSGDFTAKITLEGGYNNLVITAFDSTGKSVTREIMVTYTTSKI